MINNTVAPLELTDSMAVKIIRECVDRGRVIFTHHATERMVQRNIDRAQVFDCLRKGTVKEPAYRNIKGSWQITLERVSTGQTVTVPVGISYATEETKAVIITVY